MELLPDVWRLDESKKDQCCHQPKSKKPLITDIVLWLECYATMVALLSLKYPAKTPHFMAYQHTIIQASRNFEGIAWATYDMCYRRKAANIKSWDWGTIDQDLYSRAFTGRAKQRPRCHYCLSENHASADCSYSMVGGQDRQLSAHPRRTDLCRLYNKVDGTRCRFVPCRYVHECSRCAGEHPLASCTKNGPRERSPQSFGSRKRRGH